MTKEEFDNIIADIINPNADWHLSKIRVINLCKQMCNKQKEICAESVRLDIIPDKYSLTGKRLTPSKESITNAPYPEELL